jgi:aminocarboxymuconate-semialdehyde decarboxylase
VLKQFYGDTALCGSVAGNKCGIDFFGAAHVLFASDSPFGPEQGAGYIRLGIEAMEKVDIPTADKEKINYRNAQSFFGLK